MTALLAAALLAVAPPMPPYDPAPGGVAVATAGATRMTPPSATTTTQPVPALDLFAPDGLDGCDEFRWYRQLVGLPAKFDQIAWRESNCRQELGVHTSCCWGWLQLNATLHLKDHRLAPRYHDCGVYSRADIDGPEPIDKLRHMCAAKALFDVVGYSAWSTS